MTPEYDAPTSFIARRPAAMRSASAGATSSRRNGRLADFADAARGTGDVAATSRLKA